MGVAVGAAAADDGWALATIVEYDITREGAEGDVEETEVDGVGREGDEEEVEDEEEEEEEDEEEGGGAGVADTLAAAGEADGAAVDGCDWPVAAAWAVVWEEPFMEEVREATAGEGRERLDSDEEGSEGDSVGAG